MDGKFLLESVLVFFVSWLPLWGMGPDEANDDESLLRQQLALLEDTLKITAEIAKDAIENSREIAQRSGQRLNQVIRDEEEWKSYVYELHKIQTVCLRCASEIAALENLAVAIRNAALHGLYPSYLPDGNVTDPIMEAWAAFSSVLRSPSGSGVRLSDF